MESYRLKEDIKVMCINATSFPQGVEAAYSKLYDIAGSAGRIIYGLSKPNEQGVIIYKAAATEKFAGEAEQLGLESYTIPKGAYVAETIFDWRNNMLKFAPIFSALLDNRRLDRSTWCVEWYKSPDEVLCMIKLQ